MRNIYHLDFKRNTQKRELVRSNRHLRSTTPLYMDPFKKDISAIKTKKLNVYHSSVAQNSPGPVANIFATPTKGFITPSTPKKTFGKESVSSEAVKEKAKYTVLFYRLLLSSKYMDKNTNQDEIILGNLSEDFITSLNISTRSESIQVFNNAFSPYRKIEYTVKTT